MGHNTEYTNQSYVVTGTDANGCTNTAGTLVQVRVLPVVVLDKSTDSICAGNTGVSPVVLSPPSNGTSYTWDNGLASPGTFIANTTTIYTMIMDKESLVGNYVHGVSLHCF